VTGRSSSPRLLLGLAAVAVAFAAADTYVVVLALLDMMQGVGISPDQLQRAAPIVSGFLLGYVAMLPLIGRIADLRGRLPVLTASLVVFAVGSAITAAAYDLPTMVGGRFLQGVGGGGLVPATLALVADIYPKERRAVPLGLVSAVQEIGSVVGPLFGAVVLAVADWRAIFLVNLAVGLVLAAGIAATGRGSRIEGSRRSRSEGSRGSRSEERASRDQDPRRLPDLPSLALVAIITVAGWLTFQPPRSLVLDLTWGELFLPVFSLGPLEGRWLTPLGLLTLVALVLLVVRLLLARRPLVDLRAWGRSAREADLVGSGLLAVALGGVVLAFATADPKIEVFSDAGLTYLLVAAVATVAFVVHLRRARDPLFPRGALVDRVAWGSIVVSFFVGSALIAALIDVPLFARTTIYQDSQLLAALVLLRFLAALPVGAVIGGYLTRTLPASVITAVGMVMAAVGFAWMSTWDLDALESWTATVPLVLAGLGFGLALAPVNAAVLAATDAAVHGLASAMVVVARMVGMLVGISALTTIGLRRYYAVQGDVTPADVCPDGRTRCDEFSDLVRAAGIAQEQTVFAGAAVCALVAAVLALVLLRGAPTRGSATPTGLPIG